MAGVGKLEAVTLDVSDLERSMAFWGAVLDVRFGPSVVEQCRSATIAPGLTLDLQLVPERKTATKNRMHMDVQVADLDQGLREVKSLGGTLVHRVHDEGFDPLYVCADPDGNEFCLVLS
jgi:predicted enzyme related to lactoylglutathione lyase